MKRYEYDNKGNVVNEKRKIGFWEFCLGIVACSAAVKIVKSISSKKTSKKSKDEDEDEEELDEDDLAKSKDIDYLVYESKRVVDVIKCRRKIAELMDLYDCCTESEIQEVMGLEPDSEDLEHKVFNAGTKFRVMFKNGKYQLYSQAPELVWDDQIEKEEALNGKIEEIN